MNVHSSCRLLITKTLSNPFRTTTHVRFLHSHHAKNQPRQTTDSRHLFLPFMDLPDQPYSKWSPERLIKRVVFLEKELREKNIRYVPLHFPHASLCIRLWGPSLIFYPTRVQNPLSPSSTRRKRNPRVDREFDPANYSTRLIALKIAYLGGRYNGFEHHANNETPCPPIEEELWKALNKARLIFPTPNSHILAGDVNWEGCEFSKCGRTDKGVSAFGQVIGVRVRSNRPLGLQRTESTAVSEDCNPIGSTDLIFNHLELASPPLSPTDDPVVKVPTSKTSWSDESLAFHPIDDEIPYMQVLNRILPPDIRVLAWCAAPPTDFSARFSCKERRYRYFFTQPAFNPTPGPAGLVKNKTASAGPTPQREGWLDIEAMRDGAKRFIGLHDFRNFCKVDGSKQLENFERTIFHAAIEEADEGASYVSSDDFKYHKDSISDNKASKPPFSDEAHSPTVYTFTLHGSAFLWHQVRHMVAILFHIGQGFESPELVSELLDIHKHPQKPMYEMADSTPLVLWDCIFPRKGSDPHKDALEWLYIGDSTESEKNVAQTSSGKNGNGKYGLGGVVDEMWKVWRQSKMDGILAGNLLDVIAKQGSSLAANPAEGKGKEEENEGQSSYPSPLSISATGSSNSSQKVFLGGKGPRLVGRRYGRVLQKPRMDSVETLNANYARRKGFEQSEKIKEQGWRRVVLSRSEEEGGPVSVATAVAV